MGLWNFVKEAGASVFGKAEAAEAPDAAIMAEIESHGLDTTGLEISVEGDTVKLGGTAVSQEIKEKVIMAAGNVEGIAAVQDEVAGPDPVFYEVKKGDSLWKIAAETLGSGARYPEIFEANRPMLSDPDKIYPGQSLRIPQE